MKRGIKHPPTGATPAKKTGAYRVKLYLNHYHLGLSFWTDTVSIACIQKKKSNFISRKDAFPRVQV